MPYFRTCQYGKHNEDNLLNAIITAATGYRDADLRPFLISVARTCPDAKLFLIAFRRDRASIDRLRDRFPFIEPVYVPHKLERGGRVYRWIARTFIPEDYRTCHGVWKRVGRYSLHIMLERFFLALEVVRAHRSSLNRVMVTDCRDVVLQRNPFRRIGNQVMSGLEEKPIGECPVNSGWIRDLYGEAVHARMSACRIVCSGVTLGPTAEVEQYLGAMGAEIWKRLSTVALMGQYDQGIHNYLIYHGGIRVELTDNRAGIIASLHHEEAGNLRIDAEAGIVMVHGTAPDIIHQYDRHPGLAAFIRQRFQG